jgi:bile acid:Na+ symporter, BASS family
MMFETLPIVLIYVFLVTTMLVIGLTVTAGEILSALRDWKLMSRLLVANLVLVPLLGYLLIVLIPLSPGVKLGLALLALMPGGLTAIQFTDKVKGNLGFAAAVAFVLTILSIFVSPILIKIILPREVGLDLPFMRLIFSVIFYLLLPLLVGFGIRTQMEKAAKILGKIMLIISNVSFITTIILTMAMKKQAMGAVGKTTILTMLGFIIGSMVIGWVLGGPEPSNRRVMAIATNMRNAGVGLIMATRMFSSTGADVAIIAYMGLMVPPNLLYTLYHGVSGKIRSKKIAAADGGGKSGVPPA